MFHVEHKKQSGKNMFLVRKQMQLFEKGIHILNAEIDDKQAAQIEQYLVMLIKRNKKINLFSGKDMDRISERHLLESIAWIPCVEEQLYSPIMDLGSGAGFPGIPLAILKPDKEVILVESNRKKVLFLKEVVKKLNLNASVAHQRVEEMRKNPENIHRFPWIVSRAVAKLSILIKWAYPLLSEKGTLIAFKGDSLREEIRELHSRKKNLLRFSVTVAEYNVCKNLDERPVIESRKVVKIKMLV